jgi:hypothetical protein
MVEHSPAAARAARLPYLDSLVAPGRARRVGAVAAADGHVHGVGLPQHAIVATRQPLLVVDTSNNATWIPALAASAAPHPLPSTRPPSPRAAQAGTQHGMTGPAC